MSSVFQMYGYVVQLAMVYAIMSYGLWLVFRAGMFATPHAGVAAIASYTASLLTMRLEVPFLVSILAAMAISAVVGLAVALPLRRIQGIYLAIATIAFGEVVYSLAFNLEDITKGGYGLTGIPRSTEWWHLVLTLAILIYFFVRVDRSRVGRAWDACHVDSDVASVMGIDVVRNRLSAFAIGCAITGMGSAFYAHLMQYIDPAMFRFGLITNLFSMSILGGSGHWLGPILGSTVLTFLPELLRPFAEYRMIVNGFLMVVILLFMPRGLVGIGPLVGSLVRRLTETSKHRTPGAEGSDVATVSSVDQ